MIGRILWDCDCCDRQQMFTLCRRGTLRSRGEWLAVLRLTWRGWHITAGGQRLCPDCGRDADRSAVLAVLRGNAGRDWRTRGFVYWIGHFAGRLYRSVKETTMQRLRQP